jgi:DNA-binding transcriptional ArsR family regulator
MSEPILADACLSVHHDQTDVVDLGSSAVLAPRFVKLPLLMLQAGVGAEALTFSVLCWLPEVRKSGFTFRQVKPEPSKPGKSITELSGLPYRTVKLHLRKLAQAGLIRFAGRQGRRTNTIVVDDEALAAYLGRDLPFLPIMESVRHRLSWSENLVFAAYVKGSGYLAGQSTPIGLNQARFARQLSLSRLTVRKAIERLTTIGLLRPVNEGFALPVL